MRNADASPAPVKLPEASDSEGGILHSTLARAGYRVQAGGFSSGRPDRQTLPVTTRSGLPAVAKVMPAEAAVKTFSHMKELWRSSFGERRQPPGLPQPLDCLPELGVLIMQRLDALPMAESGPLNESNRAGAMKLLAALHSSDAKPETRRSWRGILRSVERKAAIIAQTAPQYADAIRPVVQALAARDVRDTELVPSHGDFSPRNVLIGAGGFVMIDWDRFQWADPARDVAYFGISSWRADLRGGRWPKRAGLEQTIRAYCAERPLADLEKQIAFHVAAGLVRTAASLVQLWPQDAWLIPALAKAALRELENG